MISIAVLTARELLRRRFVLAAVGASAMLAALTAWAFDHIVHAHTRHGRPLTPAEIREISAALTILIAYLFSFLLAAIGTFLGAPAISNDVESGVLLPVVTRPISRFVVLCGKAIALVTFVCLYGAVTLWIEFALIRHYTGYRPPDPGAAIAFICVIPIIVIAIALALGTRLSMIASSIIAIVLFGIAWIAGIAGAVGDAVQNETLSDAGILSQLVVPTDAMWRAAVYRLEPAVMVAAFEQTAAVHRGMPPPFMVTAPPPPATSIWTAAWIIVVFAIAAWSFTRRDL